MFGKGKKTQSSTDRFVMAKGRAVGNIAPPPKSADRKGNGSVQKTAPVRTPTKAAMNVGALYTAKRATEPSKGKAGPVKL